MNSPNHDRVVALTVARTDAGTAGLGAAGPGAAGLGTAGTAGLVLTRLALVAGQGAA